MRIRIAVVCILLLATAVGVNLAFARELKAGEASYLAPNVVHRGMNKSEAPVKLFVVRIKPKDKPLVEEVPAPPQ